MRIFNKKNFRHLRKNKVYILGIFIGICIFAFMIYSTYIYFSSQTSATAPVVNYSLKVGSCETTSSATTCQVNNKVGENIDVLLNLNTNNAKMSGIDLIFYFNGGNTDHLEFINATSTSFNENLVKEVHSNTQGGGNYVHLTFVDTGNTAELPTADKISLSFNVKKAGTSRMSLITSSVIVVGPDGVDPYNFAPQNQLNSPGSTNNFENIFNISVTSTAVTTTPAVTVTPSITTTPGTTTPAVTVTPSITITPTVTITPAQNLKNLSINFRFKIQGVTSQPRNSSPAEFDVKLAEGERVVETFKMQMTPQADGTYVSDRDFKQIDLSKKYSVFVKGPKHLRKRVCQNEPKENVAGTYRCSGSEITLREGGNTLNFSNIYMLAGDLPTQNGIIDSVDLAYIRTNAGSTAANVVAVADLNYDNIVDTQDYALAINTLSYKYDE